MRVPEYLSPSSISLWIKSPEEFYKRYMADNRPLREPQLQVMSVGSSFDAHAKSYLHYALFGHYGEDDAFALDKIFETQVEEQNREWARPAGEHCFNEYKKSGALANLMLELQKSKTEPRFESTVQGTVDGIPFLGKPDAIFETDDGLVVLDWKVNGFCSKNGHSPKPGYVRLWTDNNHTMHKDCQPMTHRGLTINIGKHFESVDEDWARQESIYAWLSGAPIGDPFVAAIDQLACAPPAAAGSQPGIRVASHRGTVSKSFQESLMTQAREIWETINSDHIFRELSPETSQARCCHLDGIGNRAAIDPELKDLFS